MHGCYMQEYADVRTSLDGNHTAPDGSLSHVYGLGEWFTPCMFDDMSCHVAVARGKTSYRRQTKLVGYHHFAGSWLAAWMRRPAGSTDADVARRAVLKREVSVLAGLLHEQ